MESRYALSTDDDDLWATAYAPLSTVTQQQEVEDVTDKSPKPPRSTTTHKPQYVNSTSLARCPPGNVRHLVIDCMPCNAFEMKMGTAQQFCRYASIRDRNPSVIYSATGHYSQFECSPSGRHFYVSCRYSQRHFDILTMVCPCVAFLSAMIVQWRQVRCNLRTIV